MISLARVKELYEWGAKLYVCGLPAIPQMVQDYITREEYSGMPVIFYDSNGAIVEIHFD